MGKLITLNLFLFFWCCQAVAQCVTTFPYIEGFESNSAWTSGGSNSDWAWGTPAHTNINTAGGGTKCWMVGGLTGSFYNYSELSWLESPCFDFTTLTYPWISFKIYWESEWRYDGMVFQYSLNGGASWTNVGTNNDPVNCLSDNWYNHNNISWLSSASPKHGWCGRAGNTVGSCQGGNGSLDWVTAKHCITQLAGEPSVKFRFLFGAGTTCNSYDGIAVDDIYIGNAAPNVADFTYSCAGGNTIDFTNTSQMCPIGYLWDFGDGATSNSQNPSHTYSNAGTYNVTLTINGPCNAPGSITIPVSILDVAALPTDISCNGANDGLVSANATGSSGQISYIWSNGDTSPNISGLSAGSYTVTVSSTGSCSATASAIIMEPAVMNVSATGIDASCGSDGEVTANVSGGSAPYTYLWQPTGGTSATASGLNGGTYTVIVTDASSCTTAASVSISQPSNTITATITTTPAACSGYNGSATIIVSGGASPYTYSWSPAGGNGATATGLAAGTYTVLVGDANSCQVSFTTNITGSGNIMATLSSTPASCDGIDDGTAQVAALGGSGIYTYQWNNGETTGNLVGIASGNYCVTVSDENGCATEGCVPVTALSSDIVADFKSSPKRTDIFEPDVSFYNETENAISWQWSFGDTTFSDEENPMHTYEEPGIYQVTLAVMDSLGCVDTVVGYVTIDEIFTFYAPSAVAPKGRNKVFMPVGTGWDLDSFGMWIYNRWGNEIYHTQNPMEGWDCKLRESGELAETGTYNWIVYLKQARGMEHKFIGSVVVYY